MRHPSGSTLAAIALMLVTGGCLTEPNGTVVQGEFGGYMLGLSATATDAHHRLPCGRGVTGPLRIGPDGTATARGLAGGFSPDLLTDSLVVVAEVHGYLLDVTHTIIVGGNQYTGRTTLLRGAAPDFSGVACPAS